MKGYIINAEEKNRVMERSGIAHYNDQGVMSRSTEYCGNIFLKHMKLCLQDFQLKRQAVTSYWLKPESNGQINKNWDNLMIDAYASWRRIS